MARSLTTASELDVFEHVFEHRLVAAMVSAPAQRGRPETVGRSEGDRPLPVLPALEPLFPAGGLRRGSAVAVRGSASLLLALLAGPSRQGAWCGVVGLPGLGLVAAAEAGIALERLALVPDPGRDWAAVAAALLDAMEVVVVAPRGRVPDGDVRRLAARARQRGAVLVSFGSVPWPGAELRLSLAAGAWEGLGEGSGHLRSRRVIVRGEGRGSAARVRELPLWLPGPDGEVRAAPTLHAVPTPPGLTPAPAPTPLLRAVPDFPTPGPPTVPAGLEAPARRTSSPGGPGGAAGVVETPSIAALRQDVAHRPGWRPPGSRRGDGSAATHPRPSGPPRRGPRAAPLADSAHRDPSTRIAAAPPPLDPGRHPPTAPPSADNRHPPTAPPSADNRHHPPAAPPLAGWRDQRPRPAGSPVPAGRPAPVGGGSPVPPPPTAGTRPTIPAEVLARLRPASTLPKPPPRRAAEG